MPKDKMRSAAHIWILIAAAATLGGCALETGRDEDIASLPEGAQRPTDPVSDPRVSMTAIPVEHHHICYEDEPLLHADGSIAKRQISLRCRANDGGCAINGGTPGTVAGETTASVPYSVLSSPYTATASFTFVDGSTHSCSYTVGAPIHKTSGAMLNGYTTDSSGLVTTGVWKRRSIAAEHAQTPNGQYVTTQLVQVPTDFQPIGGGVVGVPDAAFIFSSWLDYGWYGRTSSNSTAVDHDNDTYVIGLKVEGLTNLPTLLQTSSSTNPSATSPVAHPSAQVTLPAGSIALGGGGYGYTPPPAGSLNAWQQYLTASKPGVTAVLTSCSGTLICLRAQVTDWTLTATEHLTSAPGVASVRLYSLPLDVTINGTAYHFEGTAIQGKSAAAAQPSVVVKGAAGFALTGVGAFVDWQQGTNPQGNLLWKIQPRPDVLGVEAASTEHGAASPAAITGYAVGIKLVPGHS